MATKKEISNSIFNAVDEVNLRLPETKRLKKGFDTVLWGPNDGLDSLGLVNLIVTVEERLEEECAIHVNLADQRSMSEASIPFSTIGSLVEYVSLLLEKNQKDG